MRGEQSTVSLDTEPRHEGFAPILQKKEAASIRDGPQAEVDSLEEGSAVVGAPAPSEASPLAVYSNSGETVQRTPIKTAGLELELKGASVVKGLDATSKPIEFDSHEKVIDKGDWWIEVDSYNAELVTKETDKKATLFGWLASGTAKLQGAQELSEKGKKYYAMADKASSEAKELEEAIATDAAALGLPGGSITIQSKEPPYHAKPQISFGIKKDKLAEFGQYVMGPKIQYSEGYEKGGKKWENTEWPRVNVNVQSIYYGSKMWQTKKGGEFLAKLGAASNEAKGLGIMTVITVLFALRKQKVEDEWQYYKAKFSVMPRVPLSDLYDTLTESQQTEYKNLMVLWLAAIRENNAEYSAEPEHQVADQIYDHGKKNSIDVEEELLSISDVLRRLPKTRKAGKKQVDAISSDQMASTENVGVSVGALDLPDDSAGIFEIRTLPYINIKDAEKVETLFNETINAYGGMD